MNHRKELLGRIRAPWPALALAAALPALSVLADEVKDGEALADRLCAKCHVVSQQVGPAFVDVAKGPRASRDALRDFLRGAHSDVSHQNAMPSPGLDEKQIDALSAYIASLHGAK